MIGLKYRACRLKCDSCVVASVLPTLNDPQLCVCRPYCLTAFRPAESWVRPVHICVAGIRAADTKKRWPYCTRPSQWVSGTLGRAFGLASSASGHDHGESKRIHPTMDKHQLVRNGRSACLEYRVRLSPSASNTTLTLWAMLACQFPHRYDEQQEPGKSRCSRSKTKTTVLGKKEATRRRRGRISARRGKPAGRLRILCKGSGERQR